MATLSNHYSHQEDSTFPPFPESRAEVNPTLLVSWWCTLFAAAIIFIRLGGRWIRTEQMFAEDKIMALAVIPLFVRMGCVHYVLKYGTNNVVTTDLTADDIARREIGSKLVLVARIFYAMFMWTAKLTIADFLHRIYSQMWTRKHDMFLQGIKWFLGLTFVGLVIATLAECHPFSAYWQVLPDPGPNCRDAQIQLISMGVFDSITDIFLVAFPLPIIFSSNMKLERKISLSLLFSLSLILVGITIYRVQATIDHHYSQRFRSLLASFEILAAAGISNAIVLGSFLRDRGVKKNKFKQNSTGEQESILDRPSNVFVSARSHPAAYVAQTAANRSAHHVRGLHSWGSDIDLVEDLGMRLGPEFHVEKKPRLARPAPAALPMVPLDADGKRLSRNWSQDRDVEDIEGDMKFHDSNLDFDQELDDYSNPPSPKAPFAPRAVDFFDVGGLLGDAADGSSSSPARARTRKRRQSSVSFAPLPSASSNAPLIPFGLHGPPSRDVSPNPSTNAPTSPPRRKMPRERLGAGAPRSGGFASFKFPFQPPLQTESEEPNKKLDKFDTPIDSDIVPSQDQNASFAGTSEARPTGSERAKSENDTDIPKRN